MKIKNIILNTFATIFIITLFLFAFTWIIFNFQGSSSSLKDTWSIVSSLFGGITTLAAAYIASLLFNDWRKIEKFKAIQILHNEAILALLICSKELNRITGQLQIIKMEKDRAPNTNLSQEKQEALRMSFFKITKEVIINVQDATFNICIKIAMDYTRPLNNDSDLKFMFDTLNDVKNFIQKIAHDKGIDDNNIEETTKFIHEFNTKVDHKIIMRNLKSKDF